MAINTSLLVTSVTLQEPILDDATGLPLVGGIVTLYQDNSRTTFKNWYYLSGAPGSYSYLPLNNPLTLNAAGVITDPNGNDTLPYFYPYSEADNVTPQPYYITVTDAGGHSKITRQDFPFNPASQNVVNTVNATLKNYIVNGGFWRNNAPAPNGINLTSVTSATLAPSIHQGLTNPDITFSKSTGGANDAITFNTFSAGQFLNPNTVNPQNLDVTPEYSMNFTCSGTGSETFKYVQFPIALHLKSMDSVPVTLTFWSKCNSAGTNGNIIKAQVYQYAGSGTSSSVTTIATGGTFTLPVDQAWHKNVISFTMPSAVGIALGAGGDDAVFIQLAYPTGAVFNIDIAKPCLYIGNQAPTNDIEFYDQAEAIFNSPRTGDYRKSLNNYVSFGWIAANGSTIGSSASAATTTGQQTWPLYNLLWGSINNAFAPVSSGRGASAIADFSANKTLAITSALGNSIIGLPINISCTYNHATVPSWHQGDYAGAPAAVAGLFTLSGGSNNTVLYPGAPVTLTGTLPTAGAFTAGTVYYAIPDPTNSLSSGTTFQLATTYANAIGLVAIAAVGTNDGGAMQVNFALGGNFGQGTHLPQVAELVSHTHPPGAGTKFAYEGGSGDNVVQAGGAAATSATTGATGDSNYYNTVMPVSYANVFIKL